jgi:hypothetical protein
MVVQGAETQQFSKVCSPRYPVFGYLNAAISQCWTHKPTPRHPLSTAPLVLLEQALPSNTTELKMTQDVASTFPALASPKQPPPKLVLTKGRKYNFWIFAQDSEGEASPGVQVRPPIHEYAACPLRLGVLCR